MSTLLRAPTWRADREYIFDTHLVSSQPPHPGPPPLHRHAPRTSCDPPRVHYTRSWFGLGAVAAVLGAVGMHRYGTAAAAGMGVLGLLGLQYMCHIEPRRPILERVTLQLPALPAGLDGLRIGQITDMHLGLPYTGRNLRWAVAHMQRERPDLIVLTGDFAGRRQAIPDLVPLLRGLHAPLGIYAVPGNHDYGEGLPDIRAALALNEIPLLLNEHRRLHWNGTDFWLIGTDDVWEGHFRLADALQGVPRGAFTVLLSHAPDSVDEAASHGIALQLSGHTHGGHLRLPLFGAFTRPRFGAKYVLGPYRAGTTLLYVSRGIGGTPLRLLCPPEATIFTLRTGV